MEIETMNQTTWIVVAVVILVVIGGYLGRNQIATMMSGSAPQTSTDQSAPPITPQETTPPAAATAAGLNTVDIKNFAFSPASMTIKVGDKVTWTNQDSAPHSATADDKSFDTGEFGTGKSESITFSKAGTYPYHCSLHPNMKATIIVQ